MAGILRGHDTKEVCDCQIFALGSGGISEEIMPSCTVDNYSFIRNPPKSTKMAHWIGSRAGEHYAGSH